MTSNRTTGADRTTDERERIRARLEELGLEEDDFEALASDFEALRGDWQAVGDDLRQALHRALTEDD